MKINKGYIYIRTHSSYDEEGVCKLGKTNNIPERDIQYATGEIRRGVFKLVFEVSNKKTLYIEKKLQQQFCDMNIKYDGGVEFYEKKIIKLIEPKLKELGIEYRKLSRKEIEELIRCNRINQIKEETEEETETEEIDTEDKETEETEEKIIYKPRQDQEEIIKKAVKHYEKNDKGMLILMCGVGKTLISLWITEKIKSQSIIIGVPNKLLLEQWKKNIKIIFEKIPYLIVASGVKKENIIDFIQNQKKCIIITTYSSAHKVYKATEKIKYKFDMKILDEVHHLTTENMKESHTTKKYVQMLNIKSRKQISLTATIKQLEDMYNSDNMIVSNDNIEYFGEIIEKKNLLWAINKKIICDYVIQTIITDDENEMFENEINNENDKRLLLSAYVALKSINEKQSHHLLVYTNNKENSLKIQKYIKMLLEKKYYKISKIHYSNYHSEMKKKKQQEIINNFTKSKYGIISCVYCLGEGWDMPLLDGVVFAENMTSNIRIVQSALRASRKNKNEENKITKIILPILNINNWIENNENNDLKKIRKVIYQMGLEDETITDKIKVYRINIKKNKKIKKKDRNNEIGEYDNEITKELRLKTLKRTILGTTYEKAKKIIANKKIKSKESYYELCKKDNRLTEEPEITYKGQFEGWIEYLNIERKYYDLKTCMKKVKEYLKINPEIKKMHLELSKICEKLCEKDELFPPKGIWVDYYSVRELKELIIIKKNKKKIKVTH